MLKILIPTILLASLITTISPKTPNIFGVRWFLGNHFRIGSSPASSEYYILMFNSQSQIDGRLIIKFNNTKYTCSSSTITTQTVVGHEEDIQEGRIINTTIHRCVVRERGERRVAYRIYVGVVGEDYNVGEYREVLLFSGNFRVPSVRATTKILNIGDWGIITKKGIEKGYKDISPCLKKTVAQNQDIIMVVFNGDLAYDFQGDLYFKMLNYLEWLTSQMVFMITPGNHDTLYHADTFELFTASFQMPGWDQYFNYFSMFSVGKIGFISYDPQLEAYGRGKADRLHKDVKDIFEKELTPQIQTELTNNYFTIAYSHYPIYCSNPYDDLSSCQNNVDRLGDFLQYFQKVEMDLYLSAHLHVYERTKPICFNGSIVGTDGNVYETGCPVYVVQGVGGNDDYVQMDEQYQGKEFSASLLYGTGYGLISFQFGGKLDQQPSKVTFNQISTSKCEVKDEFTLITKQQDELNGDSTFRKYLYLIILILSALGIMTIIYFYCRRKNMLKENQTQEDKHVQMVQEKQCR